MASPVLIIHERLGIWARHMRPRFVEASARMVETRSTDDLVSALERAKRPFPVVLIDLAGRIRAGLDDLASALEIEPDSLVLVLDPASAAGVAALARELGATHVISGSVTPPVVYRVLSRWLTLASRRAESAGWTPVPPKAPEPEPWNWLNPLLEAETADQGSPRKGA